jgi:hypothetical protein
MLGWDACTLEPNAVLRWIECHPSAAGWAQAFGTFVAVLVAIAVPAIGRYLESTAIKADRADRSRQFVTNLLPYIGAIRLAADQTKFNLEKLAALPENSPAVPDALRAVRIELSPVATDALLRMHDFDPNVTRPISNLIAVATTFNGTVDAYTRAASVDLLLFERTVKTNAIASLKDHLQKLEPFIAAASKTYSTGPS